MAEDRKFEKPVAWLGGRDLLANLKKFILFAAFKGKLDPRDWMRGEIFPLGKNEDPHYFEKYITTTDGTPEFWFDYFADAGDGMTAGYSLAYLCMSDLSLAADQTISQLTPNQVPTSKSAKLPRGAFLLVGGDTAYHVADYPNLGARFQKVFEWAFKDRKTVGLANDEMWWEENRRPIFGVPGNHDYYDMIDGFNRQFGKPITAELDFLNLAGKDLAPQLRLWLFKRFQTASYMAIRMPFGWWLWGIDSELDPVDIRQQEFFKRSYLEGLRRDVIAELTDSLGRYPSEKEIQEKLPTKQRYEFGDRWPMPEKLIVATSEPTTVEGRRSDIDDKTSRAFCLLDLKRPFLYLGAEPTDERTKEIAREQELKLNDFRCRLDISGDTHHYARYWGEDTRRLGGAWSQSNYASVVSGGGGASMSPTQTDVGQVPAQAIYPSKDVSRQAIYQRLFNPVTVLLGGNVWLAGFIIAFIIYLELSSPSSHYAFTSALLDQLPGIAATHQISLKQAALGFGHSLKLVGFLGVAVVSVICSILYARWLFDRLTKTYDWAQEQRTNLMLRKQIDAQLDEAFKALLKKIERQERVASQPWIFVILTLIITGVAFGFGVLELWFYAPWGTPGRLTYNIGATAFSLALLLLTCLTVILSKLRLKAVKDIISQQTLNNEEKIKAITNLVVTPTVDYLPFWSLLVLAVVNLVCVFYEFSQQQEYGLLPRFGNSVCILFLIVVAGSSVVGAIFYSKWLFEQSYRIKVNFYSYGPVYGLVVVALAALIEGVWLTGTYEARFLLADILFSLLVLAVFGGCGYLALGIGNKVQTLRRWVIFSLLGLWHAILQAMVPLLLVWVGGWRAIFAAVAIVVVASAVSVVITNTAPTQRITWVINRPLLSVAWLVFGLVMLVLPIVFHKSVIEPGLLAGSYTRLNVLFSASVAGAVGLGMSCVWLGWYFAVSLVFGGHANEAGSTARIEAYKEFIRFRLTEDALTGYVIGIDKPQTDGTKLSARLVDKFTLTCT